MSMKSLSRTFRSLKSVPYGKLYHLIGMPEEGYAAFLTYSNKRHEWLLIYRRGADEWIHADTTDFFISVRCAVFDPQSNALLCVVEVKWQCYELVVIDIQQPMDIRFETKLPLSCCISFMILVGDSLYMFGYSSRYIVVNIKSWTHQTHGCPPDLNTVVNAAYLKNRRSIFILGLKPQAQRYATVAYELSLETNAFTRFESLTFDHGKLCSSMVSTMDHRYIVFVGGYDTTINDTISVYDIKLDTLKQSVMKCPSRGYHGAINMCSTRLDELLVFGYVRDKFKRNVPHSLIKLMAKWMSNEYIHLVGVNHGHWRVNIDELLKVMN